jgi:ABC-type amino acid transport system permease subunit
MVLAGRGHGWLATVLGTLVGIARLSANWLLSRLAAVYVEVLRDIPLLRGDCVAFAVKRR